MCACGGGCDGGDDGGGGCSGHVCIMRSRYIYDIYFVYATDCLSLSLDDHPLKRTLTPAR